MNTVLDVHWSPDGTEIVYQTIGVATGPNRMGLAQGSCLGAGTVQGCWLTFEVVGRGFRCHVVRLRGPSPLGRWVRVGESTLARWLSGGRSEVLEA
jgi:hypothetical protein